MSATPEPLTASAPVLDRRGRVERGDWQTPAVLATDVMGVVTGLEPGARAVLEPTCGEGAFLVAAGRALPGARLVGYELSPEYAAAARGAVEGLDAEVTTADFFETDWESVLARLPEPFVIVGNPPWVTSATLGAFSGTNLPPKSNFKGESGFDALTGKSNFDISEWILLRLLTAARGRRFTLGMLCKASVARRIMQRAFAERWAITGSVRAIDAQKHFAAAVSAVLLVLRSAQTGATEPLAWDVYDGLRVAMPTRRMGVRAGRIVGDLDAHRRTERFEGKSELVWRSGLKHDLARVMELTSAGGVLTNGFGEIAELEPTHVYPLLKGSDLGGERPRGDRFVLVTQERLGDDTSELARVAPLTWRYLERYRALFDARKSRIYRGQAPFAMFGVGEYSFAPYKLAISGLHKRLAFRVVGPREGRPVMLDDTCYFLPCPDEATALRLARLLDSAEAREFFEARVFWDEMRPITKTLLGALSLEALEREGVTGSRPSSSR